MRVVIAGATGVIGRQLVPLLTAAGHEVVALSRTPRPGAARVTTVAVDALDPAALAAAVRDAQPDAVVHLLTAIPAEINPRRMKRDFALTNRLRTEATRTLVEAAHDAGAGRFIAQGVAFVYDPDGGAGAHERLGPNPELATEDTPFWRDPPQQMATTVEAVTALERLTAEADGGLVLRFGHLYGPGTVYASDGSTVGRIRAGRLPLVGHSASTFSFLHTRDAAGAVLAALEHPEVTGALNIVDDDPAPVGDWLPALAGLLRAPAPKHVPTALARLAVGAAGVAFMTRLRGATAARAAATLNWAPTAPSWRTGLAAEYEAAAVR